MRSFECNIFEILETPNLVFTVTEYFKSAISKMVRLRDKVTIEH